MRKVIIIACITLGVSLMACNWEKHHREDYHTVAEKVERLEVEETPDYGFYSLDNLQYEDLIPVDQEFVKDSFLIPDRLHALTMFPCSNCHNQPIEEMKKIGGKKKASHWDIELNHANELTMNCQTCHDGNKPDQLHSLTGDDITFSQSYQVCSQCHTGQYEDWKIGAHGKRLGGWAPPRVINSCMNCHNPHKPAFPSRYPARHNSVLTEQHRKADKTGSLNQEKEEE